MNYLLKPLIDKYSLIQEATDPGEDAAWDALEKTFTPTTKEGIVKWLVYWTRPAVAGEASSVGIWKRSIDTPKNIECVVTPWEHITICKSIVGGIIEDFQTILNDENIDVDSTDLFIQATKKLKEIGFNHLTCTPFGSNPWNKIIDSYIIQHNLFREEYGDPIRKYSIPTP